MVERGVTSPPIDKILDYVVAYEIDKFAFFKKYFESFFPNIWDIIIISAKNPEEVLKFEESN